ncbi:hypothetical protein [Streptomyces sp. Wh19]|uniref:Integrase n=1 Tax=Streptomyces sanglieri TaxID=193460 RepID=A0ABW2WYX0_9ACTN|nr:hypothetical protein [Streptomyces sp. Wh19]MDV9195175.1 hypothetical protein [Streptomyces sp. Wh19]
MAHAAGAGLKDIQEMPGHSSITTTSDTYTSLLPEAEPAPPPRTPDARRAPSPARPTSSCWMMPIRWAIFGRSTPRPLTHRSRKRPRTRSPRPGRAPPWERNPRSER